MRDFVGSVTYNNFMDTFDPLVTADSKRELKQAEFDRQVDLLRPLMNWDPARRSWQVRLSGAHPEHVSSVLTTLFEAPRLYGTTVTVRPAPAVPTTPAEPVEVAKAAG
ncbi:hypothetical protein E1286_41580 [Nonomuraea terrae]|uniref:Uncharacterized protein n=1 Tax=Nonomuraea terrae TaxID=2530383 RepID=A0A4R4XRS4_9ACTN|nr:hypothetical protein [Nonomuraea terrae]TDD33870.1 hypothetical protein E1286_41580 [Nonomuraea terrae]